MTAIKAYIDGYYLKNGKTPTLRQISARENISLSSVHRYLKSMSENGMISCENGKIETDVTRKGSRQIVSIPIVGSVICGDPEEEQQHVDGYVNLPESIFGHGTFFILKARGDSMTDAGINEGDYVVIRRQEDAEKGDIVVALDGLGENTLKKYTGFDEEGYAVLEYMNRKVYGIRKIRVKKLIVQGVAKHVIKAL